MRECGRTSIGASGPEPPQLITTTQFQKAEYRRRTEKWALSGGTAVSGGTELERAISSAQRK